MAIASMKARGRPDGRPARPKALPAGLLAIGLPLIAGCAGHIHLPERVAETQAQVTDLQRRQEAIAREMDELKAKLDHQEELLRQARADQNSRLGELLQSMEVIRNQLEQASRQRVRAQRTPPAPVAVDDTSGMRGTAAPADTSRGSRGSSLDEEGLYQAAFQHLQQGRYPLAISGFRQYLSQFPGGSLADEAQYGIGEAYYAQSDFATAAIEFRALVDTYPQSDKVSNALLKAGMGYYQSGKEDVGRAYLERVIQEYPRSEAARKAKERLGH